MNTDSNTPSEQPTGEHLTRLNQYARALLHASNEERIAYVRKDRFIKHEKVDIILRALRRTFESPGGERPRCLAIIGSSNHGKTALINHFHRSVGGDAARREGSHNTMPVVVVEAPSRCTAPKLELEIARAIGEPFTPAMKPRELSVTILQSLVELKTRILLINEFHHVDPIPPKERTVVYDTIKNITNRGVHVVIIGTKVIDRLRQEDEQIQNRFRPIHLNGFERKESAFLNFLATSETYYPLPQPSGLHNEELADIIFRRTKGVMGEVVSLCNAAAVHAIEHNLPCIDKKCLTDCEDYLES